MAVFALVQSHAFTSAAAATSHAIVLPLTPTQNNTVILTVVSNATVGTPTGYTLASSAVNSTGTYIFFKIAGASESSTISVVPSSSADVAVRAYEYSGLATSSVFDKQVSATPGAGTTQASGSTATLSQANELCIAVYGYPHNSYPVIPVSWSGSFIPEGAVFGAGVDQPANATATKRVTATTAVSVTVTVPSSQSGNSLCVATFKMDAATTVFTGKPANYVDSFGHFETSTAGTVVTNTILASCFSGAFSDRWITISNPDLQTAGATPGLTIETGASYAQDRDLLVEGVSFPNSSSGTRGMRSTQSANNCIQLSAGEASDISLGMHWRWHGAQIDSSPRDIVALRSDPSGNYQFIQCTDGSPPVIHVHWQPTSGTGIGSDITIAKDNWYWLQITHVPGGGTCTLSVYDAQNAYTLVGTSTAAVTGTESIGATTIQIGQIKYAAGSSQWMDWDNITLSLDGVTPTTPAPPAATGTGASTQAKNTTAGSGTVAITGTGAATQAKNTTAASGAVAISGTGAATQAANTTAGAGATAITGTGATAQAKNTTASTGAVGITGTGTDTQAGNVSAAAGAVAISGSGASTQAPNTTAGTGAVGNVSQGSGASTQAPNTTSGAGTVAISGSGASTQAANTTAGAGTVTGGSSTGTGASTQASNTTTASGSVAITGSGASSQAKNTTSGAGTAGSAGAFEYGNERVCLVGALRRVALVPALQRVAQIGN